jgi:hypothetical protein
MDVKNGEKESCQCCHCPAETHTNQVPKTGVRGSTSNNHALIFGVFATMVIGVWGSGFELVVDPFTLKKQGMIELTSFAMTDVVLKYPQAFVVAQCQK